MWIQVRITFFCSVALLFHFVKPAEIKYEGNYLLFHLDLSLLTSVRCSSLFGDKDFGILLLHAQNLDDHLKSTAVSDQGCTLQSVAKSLVLHGCQKTQHPSTSLSGWSNHHIMVTLAHNMQQWKPLRFFFVVFSKTIVDTVLILSRCVI